MDINDIRIAVTVISLLLFVALMAHTWSRRRRADYEEAAMLPFLEEQGSAPSPGANRAGGQP
jgi:cytochrome c oxidase cbb3-type subunit IV